MNRIIIVILIAVLTASCASRSRVAQYEKELDVIKTDVRSIRVMTDEMKAELLSMRRSMIDVDKSVQFQAEEIEFQRQHHERLKEIVSDIKDSVVKLESETIPAKKEQAADIYKETNSDPAADSGFIVRTEQEDGLTRVYTEKVPDDSYIKTKKMIPADIFEVDTSKTGFGYAVKDGVILWQYPTTDSDVIEILVSWQQLTILGRIKNDNINWWKVKTSEYTGFVNSKFLIISE